MPAELGLRDGGGAPDLQPGPAGELLRGLGVRHLHVVAAELTPAGLLPHLAGLKDLATDSLDRARAQVTALAAV
ncbi:hypothetical protein OG806_44130 [Streptomyces sp. NBC_00882]|uniref:hypothetical protein n=1 Tax=Streptomyces TaxID=1883 RepID=UPI003863F9BA|nr:hypothetical protein OG806_44130 [Streptomyces sp. NBC_00882]WSZ64311.1 hypothetical protein OH824_43010 [Streptomyces canus]